MNGIDFTLSNSAQAAITIVSEFQTPLVSITVSHFLLNLRAAASCASVHATDLHLLDGSTTRAKLSAFVEPLGAPLSLSSDSHLCAGPHEPPVLNEDANCSRGHRQRMSGNCVRHPVVDIGAPRDLARKAGVAHAG
ncbi:hypothetical protein CERSUDRAFT_92546 [Gelatoporia subvermispora B]|uniref:Uncharacterized protein n=1 Tax=Ceriporiopsis subvermispora (strain B) TaxID=914234 RepID=M2RNN2_CERS8|nr:hypothetical protein CERSUDRAFT_92546 [Gelatoporia subvermispora B]